MKIEVSRFADGRLKVLTKHRKSDTNVRIEDNEISICPRLDEITLERDVLEAIDLWNRIPRDSITRSAVLKEIDAMTSRHVGLKALSTTTAR